MRFRRAATRQTNPRASRRRGWVLVAASAAVLTVAGVAAAEATAGSHPSTQGVRAAAASAAAAGRPSSPSPTRPARAATHAAAPAAAQLPRTSCTSVAHVGDSTSVDLISASTLPSPAQRLQAQYSGVGVQHLLLDASGGRSIVEEMPGQQNGDRVASEWYAAGFRGCWVIALGTNDAANVAAGSTVSMLTRVREMMAAVHGEPVVWVTAQTDLTSGLWSEATMRLWNNTLVQASELYPNMRIFDWAGMVQPGWHLADGIHYTSAGYEVRAAAIARALASAFPAHRQSRTVVVSN